MIILSIKNNLMRIVPIVPLIEHLVLLLHLVIIRELRRVIHADLPSFIEIHISRLIQRCLASLVAAKIKRAALHNILANK